MILASTDWSQAAIKVHDSSCIQVLEGGSFSRSFPLLSVVILESEMCVAWNCKEVMNATAVRLMDKNRLTILYLTVSIVSHAELGTPCRGPDPSFASPGMPSYSLQK